MKIRRYEPDDLSQITALFYDTVHAVNAADYSPGAAGRLGRWRAGPGPLEPVPAGAPFAGGGGGRGPYRGLRGYRRARATSTGCTCTGTVRGRGIATALLGRLERAVDAPVITTHASITARPFFEARAYRVIREQRVERHGVRMTNFVMEKRRQDG